jgi:cell division FtsZ-interacting protein ZapD
LLRYNYLQIGSRWLSPNSSSKSPGVSIKDDRWISSHASDSEIGLKLDSGSCGDAFDLFCYYEHHNDKQRAINAIKQQMKDCGGAYE